MPRLKPEICRQVYLRIGLHAWYARSHARNLMSDIPTRQHTWNARSQAWNLMLGLPTGLHAWNARSHALNLMPG